MPAKPPMLGASSRSASNEQQLPQALLALLSGAVHGYKPQTPSTPRPATHQGARPSPRVRAMTTARDDRASRPRTSQSAQGPTSLSSGVILPSERAQAQQLQEALSQAFKRSPAVGSGGLADAERASISGLILEWGLLDRCIAQLVKLISTRCLEWGDVLELIRQRLDVLWSGANALLRRHAGGETAEATLGVSAAASAPGVSPEQRLQRQIEDLREELSAAEQRALEAEAQLDEACRRAEKLEMLPAQVEVQKAELRACRALIDELSAPKRPPPATASPVLVLLPEVEAPHGRRGPSHTDAEVIPVRPARSRLPEAALEAEATQPQAAMVPVPAVTAASAVNASPTEPPVHRAAPDMASDEAPTAAPTAAPRPGGRCERGVRWP